MSFYVWARLQDQTPPATIEGGSPGPSWQRVGLLSRDSDPVLYAAIRRELRLEDGERPTAATGLVAGTHPSVLVKHEASAVDLHLALGPLDPDGGYLFTLLPARLSVPTLSSCAPAGPLSPWIRLHIQFRHRDGRLFSLNDQ